MSNEITHGRKGISAVIAVVLFLLITIAIIGFSGTFLKQITNTASDAAQNQVNVTTIQATTSFRVENVDTMNNVVGVRNTGLTNLTDLAVYIDNKPANFYASYISPNQLGDIEILDPLQMGTHTMRVTSSVFADTETFSVPDQYTISINASGS